MFVKGKSGNPAGRKKGVPTKIHREVRELAKSLFDSRYWALKYQRLHDGTEQPKIEETLLAYAYGAPPREVHSQGLIVHLGPMHALQAL
jgi:Family of unknown function (DUF5681)